MKRKVITSVLVAAVLAVGWIVYSEVQRTNSTGSDVEESRERVNSEFEKLDEMLNEDRE